MNLINELDLSQKNLRKFGITMSIMIPFIFGLIIPYIFNFPYSFTTLYIGLVFLVLGLIAPISLKMVYIPWMLVGHFVGNINSKIILSVIFYLLFTPISLFFRIIGRDSLNRKIDEQLETYRTIPSEEERKLYMERPF